MTGCVQASRSAAWNAGNIQKALRLGEPVFELRPLRNHPSEELRWLALLRHGLVKPSTFTVTRKGSARIVRAHFNKYRRDTRQQVDFTASHILVALPRILSSRPSAFMESVKISLWLRHFCRHVIIREGVYHWAAEYIHLCCVQRLQSARMNTFADLHSLFVLWYFVSWLALPIHICEDC